MQADTVVRSVHFLPIEHPRSGVPWLWPFDNPEFAEIYEHVGANAVWELYVEKLVSEIETERCDVAGHFYVPSKFGHWPDRRRLEDYEDRFIDACHRRGAAIELNTRLLYRDPSPEARHDYLAAYRRLLKKAAAGGVRVAVGSDAHAPSDQGRGFDEALALLDESAVLIVPR
jgi:HisJ family histidinol phosphate phosphatase